MENNLKDMIKQDKQQRAEKFQKVIEDAAKEFGCKLLPVVTISGGEVRGEIQVLVLDEV